MSERDAFYRAVDLFEVAVDAWTMAGERPLEERRIVEHNYDTAKRNLRRFGKLLPGRKERTR